MRQVQIVHPPYRRIVRLAVLALAEKDQLEAVAVAVAGAHVAGVIPPFGAELRVIEMVTRKLVVVARQSYFVVQDRGEKQEYEGQPPAYRIEQRPRPTGARLGNGRVDFARLTEPRA